ncbi:MAG: S8 family serine peptidase [Candidatus Aminicenantales bacterium]
MVLRRIVLIRSQKPLLNGWTARSFAPAGRLLDASIKVAGMEMDDRYHPVRVPAKSGVPSERPDALGFNYGTFKPVTTFAVRSVFDDENAIERLRHDRRRDVIGVFADPKVVPFAKPYCGRTPVGTDSVVARKLGVPAMRRIGLTGRGVRTAVVDTGIDGTRIPVAGGWGPSLDYVPGSALPDHGTMVAFDIGIAAPDARILDYALLQSEENEWSAFLSDAVAAFADLMDLLNRKPGPLVVNNSWGMFDRSEDAPIGSPENYSANPDHPFNQITGSLVAAGADVFFAAGNCGEDCPDGRCGLDDTGPGASIHGANSHPDVVTVAAVTVTDRRLGYSSQGPGGLYNRKPDLAAFSHFRGSGVTTVDSGTSAACPVAAGVAAALRQKASVRKLSPAQMKGLLQRTSRDIDRNGWDYDLGYGVIDGAAAVGALGLEPKKKRKKKKK